MVSQKISKSNMESIKFLIEMEIMRIDKTSPFVR